MHVCLYVYAWMVSGHCIGMRELKPKCGKVGNNSALFFGGIRSAGVKKTSAWIGTTEAYADLGVKRIYSAYASTLSGVVRSVISVCEMLAYAEHIPSSP